LLLFHTVSTSRYPCFSCVFALALAAAAAAAAAATAAHSCSALTFAAIANFTSRRAKNQSKMEDRVVKFMYVHSLI